MRKPFALPLKKLLFVFFILTLTSAATVAASLPQDKLKAEDVLAKHLASIGPADALADVKSLIAVGDVKAVTRTNAVKELMGVSQLGSEGDKVLLALLFNSTTYPFEKAGFNGQNLTAAILPDGKRSILGTFLIDHDAPFKQGLIGGVLSTAWPLLNTGAELPKLSYSGTDKINNRKMHKLKFDPRKSSGLQISLFFDAETFQHVRTEYQYSKSARMGNTPEESISQLESRYKVVEEFSDFKPEGKLTLPHTYKLRYTIEEQNNTQMLEWTMNFSRFAFNESIDAAAFNVSSGK
ncbi:MAG TPA: hypothetical protein VF766_07100 [Pyrinomonadaceae bacterium]